jgi:dihydrofolate reductase
MSVVFASLGISLDGFVAGPDNALGDGGGRIHGAYVMGRRMFDEGEVGWPDPSRAGVRADPRFPRALLDEPELHLAPVLLGAGPRLFDGRVVRSRDRTRTAARPGRDENRVRR